MSTSWSIVATAKESTILLSSFIAHHLSLGADAIYLYLDDAREDQYELFSCIPSVNVFLCNEEYWASRSLNRPVDHRHRQVANANHALGLCRSEWICHIDVDEYIMPPQPISQILDDCDDQVVIMKPAENYFSKKPESVRDLLTSSFHLPFPRYKEGRKYRREIGKWCEACSNGLQGHMAGKVFLRKGTGLRLNIHEAIPKEKISSKLESDIILLHFFSLGYSDWLSKNLRRMDPYRLEGVAKWKRKKLDLFFEALKSKDRDNQLLWLFEDALVYNGKKEERLKEYAGVIYNDLNLEGKVGEVFGDKEQLSFDKPLSNIKGNIDIDEEMYKIALRSIESVI
ncbi:glycosyltransferase family 2 protein [Halomonas eurihalina]|uniref:Glycosyltransferase family 2 protein n=1 Tax=Halomonas eurihalina TaxID=42566 RepID=A0A5D9DA94_HALER|nr:glycosyltransferase family 2 protein [Halomonas eurihalina]MDR5858482.1 glycosyltransferase family 2 protein [Halomonas eurihalina]TZG40676.1 glycosyltransferase family 2 protein [Halomonas eurihalina]